MKTYKPILKLSRRYMKGIVYGVVLVVASILQSLPHFIPSFGGSKPLLMIPVVVCLAMFEGPVGGAVIGIAGGFLWDLFSDRLLGFNSLLLLMICCACGLLTRLLIRNKLLSSLLMTAGAVFVQGILDWFFNYVITSQDSPFFELCHYTLPNMLYTMILTPLVYIIIYRVARFLKKHDYTL